VSRTRWALLVVASALVCAGLGAVAGSYDGPYRPDGNTLPIDDNHPSRTPVRPIDDRDPG
jgi:hypothetical protein